MTRVAGEKNENLISMTPYLATKNSLVCMVKFTTGEKLHSSSKKVAKLQGRWQNFKEGGKTSRKVAKLQAQHAELMIFILNLFSNSDPPGPSNKKFTRSGLSVHLRCYTL